MHRQLKKSRLFLILLILLLVLVVIYSGFRILESTVFSPKEEDVPASSKVITRDGVDYFPRQNITVVMLAGIDQSGPVTDSGSYNNNGTADMVALAIFDEREETCHVLMLNRDTMVDVPVLGVGGKPAGTVRGQLALAHTYGSGLADSCENMRLAVSEFLYGITIDYYVSMHTDAIAVFNDAVGGVKVNVTDDFSLVDPSIPLGETVLNGQQAIKFVQARSGVGDQLNLSRMARQKTYMDGFVSALRAHASGAWLIEAYDEAADYMVTDCSATVLNSLLERYGDYALREIVSPEGENVRGEEFMEFHVDEAALDELILRLFYAPRENN